jgi:glycosyltransferase involved in cell wall biosynthesis
LSIEGKDFREIMNRMIKTVVLIPHYNNVVCLRKTLKSIHHNKGIDVLVVDDGSVIEQVPDLTVLGRILNENVSLEILKLNQNGGIAHALNYGLDHVLKGRKYQFIARIDCGDVCVSNRFEIQEQFLINNEKIGIVGSWVKWLDSEGKQIFCKKPPTLHKKIKRKMSIRCSLIHPSTMYRMSVVNDIGKYPCNYEAAEDYAYFFDIAKYAETANIPKFLTGVEHCEDGISFSQRKKQSKSKLRVIFKYSPFGFHFLYGVIYNLCLMSVGPSTMLKMKTKIFNN